MVKKFLIWVGLACLLLGSFAFIDRAVIGFMVDILQGVLYVASALFAFAAVMRGGVSVKRSATVLGAVYALVFLAGIFNHGVVFNLFRANGVENLIHLVFAASLLSPAAGERSWLRAFISTKRPT
jgi:hypothetical protein